MVMKNGSHPDDEWRELGACWDSYDPLFFPDTYGGKAAIEVCNGCVVATPCLDYALVTNQRHGVWGGRTRSQRVRMKIRYAET